MQSINVVVVVNGSEYWHMPLHLSDPWTFFKANLCATMVWTAMQQQYAQCVRALLQEQ